MKDYFDLWILAQHATIDRTILGKAIQATFERRSTLVPKDMPLGLSSSFAADPTKQLQWKAFLAKNKLKAPELVEVVAIVQRLVGIAE